MPWIALILTSRARSVLPRDLFSWIGFETAVVPYDNIARASGETKWTTGKLVNYGIDGVLSFNSRPLRLAIYFGACISLIAFLYALWVLTDAIINGNEAAGYGAVAITSLLAGHLAEARVLGIAGAFVFSWSDDWYTGGYQIEDWAFGITRRDRTPKRATSALRSAWEATASLGLASSAFWWRAMAPSLSPRLSSSLMW